MLNYLKLRNVGPAPELELELGPRINLITGDNGLGKSFLLDVAWRALTRTWGPLPARPTPGKNSVTIDYRLSGSHKTNHTNFDRAAQMWIDKPEPSANAGLVLYAQVDGSFSVWDPARNYWRKKGNGEAQERPSAYLFRPRDIWDGLEIDGKILCNGLIRDWSSWQKEGGAAFDQLQAVLAQLSPSPEEKLIPGKLTRISLDDARDIPTLQMPYGQEVPVLHASAGMKRIIALGYLLVWAWQEHQRASELTGQKIARESTFLIDEVEAHLHPRWQRVILGAVLGVMKVLAQSGGPQVQLLCVTHSPLLLASVEPLFDAEQDRLFHFGLADGNVVLTDIPWSKQGDTTNWLVSDVFGLRQARSLEAERAIEAAEAFMRGERDTLPEGLNTEKKIHAELERVLAGHDPFWPRWIVYAENHAKGRA